LIRNLPRESRLLDPAGFSSNSRSYIDSVGVF